MTSENPFGTTEIPKIDDLTRSPAVTPAAAAQKKKTPAAARILQEPDPIEAEDSPEDLQIIKDELQAAYTKGQKKDTSLKIPKKPTLSTKEIYEIITHMSHAFSLENHVTFQAISMLYLLGAGNKNTPQSLTVEVIDLSGRMTPVSKKDLLYYYNRTTKNNFLRRLAESLATEISTFA